MSSFTYTIPFVLHSVSSMSNATVGMHAFFLNFRSVPSPGAIREVKFNLNICVDILDTSCALVRPARVDQVNSNQTTLTSVTGDQHDR